MKIAGLPVIDSTKKIKITITKDDCAKATSKAPSSCAAAKAAVRQVPKCSAARVHVGRTYLQVGNKWLRCLTPKRLRTEIIAFDRGGKFQPGTYELLPVTEREIASRGKAHALGAPKHGRVGHERVRHHVVGVRPHGGNR